MTVPFIILLCATVVGARVTRLLTADVVFQPFRDWVLRRRGAESAWTYFVHCPWCVGMWVAFVLAPLAWFTAPGEWGVSAWWGVPGVIAAMSWINGFTAYTIGGGDE